MKILNFGSLNVDCVYEVAHIVRPGETISSNGFMVNCGGKGLNQSVAAAKAGATVYHAGKMAAKDNDILLVPLLEAGVDVSYVSQESVASGQAIIQRDENGQNAIVLFGGGNREIDNHFVDEVLHHFSKGDLLILQNEISSIKYIIQKANEIGMQIAFNPSPADKTIADYPLELVNFLILNEIEGQELTGKTVPEEIIQKLLEATPNQKIILTLGEDGAIYASGKKRIIQPSFAVTTVDTTAAGDTFTGYFLVMYQKTGDAAIALCYGTAAAALAIGQKGAAMSIPSIAQVEEFLKYR